MSPKTSFFSVALLSATLVFIAPAGYGNVLPPNTPTSSAVTPDIFLDNYTSVSGYTIVADTGVQAFSIGGTSTGNIEQIVEKNNVSGLLDFLTEFSVTTGDVTRLTVSDFTNAGYGSAGFPDVGTNNTLCFTRIGCHLLVATAILPTSVDDPLVANIGFNFGSPVLAGDQTYVLVVKTNASTFSDGKIGLNGEDITANGYAPAPEPTFGGLLLGGLFSIGLVVVRKFRLQKV